MASRPQNAVTPVAVPGQAGWNRAFVPRVGETKACLLAAERKLLAGVG